MEGLQMWGIGVAVSVLVAAFIRFYPKQKLILMVEKPCKIAGVALSRVLALRLGKQAAKNFEEGVIATLAATVYSAVNAFMDGLLSDNGGNDGNK